uniref:Uncharacterized protein n=1 Tax=Musca domestica TaxID=7370 RepID=A0A1I8NGE7_MUSDO
MKTLLVISLLFASTIFQANGILRGKDAWETDVYFMARLYDKVNGSVICGGVIIDNEWVLMWAVAGSHFVPQLTSNRWQRPTVDFAVVHENYVPGEYHDDLALLHVSEPYVWTEYVRPAELPEPNTVPTGIVDVFGYGHVTIGYPTTSMATATRRLTVPIMEWSECRDLLPAKLVTDEQMVCTKQIARQSFCREDVGGPLLKIREPELPLLVGIAAWFYEPCGMKQYPNVYAQVSLYIDWIMGNIKKV